MGRAFVAVADDANAVWWNVAGPRSSAVTRSAPLHGPRAESRQRRNFSLRLRGVEGLGGIGASFGYLSYGKSTATDVDGNVTGEFTSKMAPTVAYGTDLVPNMGFGVAFEAGPRGPGARQRDPDQQSGQGTSFAADFGWLWKVAGQDQPRRHAFRTSTDIAYIDQEQADPWAETSSSALAFRPWKRRCIIFFRGRRDALPLPGRIPRSTFGTWARSTSSTTSWL
jgi:hypothetical protein